MVTFGLSGICSEPNGQQGAWHETHHVFGECSTVQFPVKYLHVLQRSSTIAMYNNCREEGDEI